MHGRLRRLPVAARGHRAEADRRGGLRLRRLRDDQALGAVPLAHPVPLQPQVQVRPTLDHRGGRRHPGRRTLPRLRQLHRRRLPGERHLDGTRTGDCCPHHEVRKIVTCYRGLNIYNITEFPLLWEVALSICSKFAYFGKWLYALDLYFHGTIGTSELFGISQEVSKLPTVL